MGDSCFFLPANFRMKLAVTAVELIMKSQLPLNISREYNRTKKRFPDTSKQYFDQHVC